MMSVLGAWWLLWPQLWLSVMVSGWAGLVSRTTTMLQTPSLNHVLMTSLPPQVSGHQTLSPWPWTPASCLTSSTMDAATPPSGHCSTPCLTELSSTSRPGQPMLASTNNSRRQLSLLSESINILRGKSRIYLKYNHCFLQWGSHCLVAWLPPDVGCQHHQRHLHRGGDQHQDELFPPHPLSILGHHENLSLVWWNSSRYWLKKL